MSQINRLFLVAAVLASSSAWAGDKIHCQDAGKSLELTIEGAQATVSLAGKAETLAVVDVTDPHERVYTEYQTAGDATRLRFFDADGGGFYVTYNGVEYQPDCTYSNGN